MRSRRLFSGTAAFVLAAGLTGLAGTNAQVQPAARVVNLPAAAPAADLVELIEFKTTGDVGYFYTTNGNEAASATSKYKFTRNTGNGTGVIGRMHSRPIPGGSNAVHRLRLKNGGPSYMLSISPSEISDARFQDEGVLGYTEGGPKPGLVRLMRFSNHGKWRAFPDHAPSVKTLTDAGWKIDGPLGWYQA